MPGTPQAEDMGGLHTLFENGIEIIDNIISPNGSKVTTEVTTKTQTHARDDVKQSETTHHEPTGENRIPDVQQKGPKWQECVFCKAGGYDKKTCKRCGLVSYCNKDCQLQDYERHKHLCRHVSRFHTAKSKIHPAFMHQLLKLQGYMDISFFLGSIPDITRYNMLGGPRMCVMLEIVEKVEDPILWKAKVRDIENKTTEILFNTFSRCSQLGVTAYLEESAILARFLKPGNFILLLNIVWRFYEPKAAQLVVDDMRFVQFIDMSK